MPVTLVAVSGMSPAIITETLWALSREETPLVPNEVIVITTTRGHDDLQTQLLTPLPEWEGKTVWQSLREDILQTVGLSNPSNYLQLQTRVITVPDPLTGVRQSASDIRSPEENSQTADFIVQNLASIADASDQKLIASIAGGRKTMGALLYGAMSLLAKETDRATHVLVNSPFDMLRGFYYPTQPAHITLRDFQGHESKAKASDAKIELADIPFVPLRNKFEELRERLTFEGLVNTYSRATKNELTSPPRVELNIPKCTITVEGRKISVQGRTLLLCAFLLDRAKKGAIPFKIKEEAQTPLKEFNRQWKQNHPCHKATTRLSAQGLTQDDLPKALADLRKKLKAIGLPSAIPYLAPERDRIGFDISKS